MPTSGCISTTAGCPVNFTYVSSIRGCYHVVVDKLQWSAATQRCISLHQNAHQVSINSAAEQTIVSNMLFQYEGQILCILYNDVSRTSSKAGQNLSIHSFSFLLFPFLLPAGRHLGFGPTGNSAVRSAYLQNPTIEPNMKRIGWTVAEIWTFEIFQNARSVGRSVVGPPRGVKIVLYVGKTDTKPISLYIKKSKLIPTSKTDAYPALCSTFHVLTYSCDTLTVCGPSYVMLFRPT